MQMFKAQVRNGLTTVQDKEAKGYATTMNSNIKVNTKLSGGLVKIKIDPEVIKILQEIVGWSVSKMLWPEVQKPLNSAITTMNNFSPLIFKFTSLICLWKNIRCWTYQKNLF